MGLASIVNRSRGASGGTLARTEDDDWNTLQDLLKPSGTAISGTSPGFTPETETQIIRTIAPMTLTCLGAVSAEIPIGTELTLPLKTAQALLLKGKAVVV